MTSTDLPARLRPQSYHPKTPARVEAMRWDGTDDCADAIYDWTSHCDRIGDMLPTRFMVLGEDQAYETFGDYDEDYELVGDKVATLQRQGYSAVVYSTEEGTWLSMRTGDYVMRTADGAFIVLSPEQLADGYEQGPITIRVQVVVDMDEIRTWAHKHAERGHVGVSAVLFDVLRQYADNDPGQEDDHG